MGRLYRALLLPDMRRVPRMPRAQGHTRRKHGRESLQPLVIDEVDRQGWFGPACVASGGAPPGCAQASGPAPGACGCAVAGLCGISAAHHGLSSEQDPRAAICMYCARNCDLTYTILTMANRCTECSTRQYMYMRGLTHAHRFAGELRRTLGCARVYRYGPVTKSKLSYRCGDLAGLVRIGHGKGLLRRHRSSERDRSETERPRAANNNKRHDKLCCGHSTWVPVRYLTVVPSET